ncbi:hypothetical protein QQ045_009126 [Rhodiola kirilowii]
MVAEAGATPPLILGLQPSALVDHVARVDSSFLDKIPGERNGSVRVDEEELTQILDEVRTHLLPNSIGLSPVTTLAGGSVANTLRGLSKCFGVPCGLIGASGSDELAQLFVRNMSVSGVKLSLLKTKGGLTAQCVCLVDAAGNRTMRPCLGNAARLTASELGCKEMFRGYRWLVLRYGIYSLEIINEAIRLAKLEGLSISLDLASFETVRNFRAPLVELLESGNIDLCFANEDEAKELIRGNREVNPEACAEYLATHCKWAVVTLGSNGCIARHGNEIVRVSAISQPQAMDATGAGDLFASGFLYGLVMGLPLEDCCKVGSCSGGAVIRSLGGDVTPENLQWMYKQMQMKGLPLPESQQQQSSVESSVV